MSGKVVVVTGASSGFGKLTVLELARRGHTVIATMRDVEGRNSAVRSELIDAAKADGNPLQVLEMDVASDESVEAAIGHVIAQHGRIDVLVNNAGLMPIGVTEAYTIADVERLFAVNVFGAIRTNRAVLPHMRAAGSGLLVQITSLMGRFVIPFFGVYAASKFALEALAETYRYELGGFGIDSVIVEPGQFPSNLISSSPEPSDAGSWPLMARSRRSRVRSRPMPNSPTIPPIRRARNGSPMRSQGWSRQRSGVPCARS